MSLRFGLPRSAHRRGCSGDGIWTGRPARAIGDPLTPFEESSSVGETNAATGLLRPGTVNRSASASDSAALRQDVLDLIVDSITGAIEP